MQLYFEIIEGDRQGTRFQIKPGLSIGRKNADILLRDSKVSGRHAVIASRGDTLYLVDNASSNGIKIAGTRVPEVALTPGVRIQIGRTLLEVIDLHRANANEEAQVETWSETLMKTAIMARDQGKAEPRQLSAFNPLLQLKFLQGQQAGTIWVLGYGPREFGTDSLDYGIEEPQSPSVCFSVEPRREGAFFRTEHPDIVHLNGQQLEEEFLADGDVIEIYKTRIQVIFKPDE